MNSRPPEHNSKTQQRQNRIMLLALLLIFAAPILLAIYLQSGFTDYQPVTTTNHGLLLEPPVPVPAREDQINAVGRPMWTLLVYSKQVCADACMEHLSWLQQLKRALGRHQDQLRLELLGAAPAAGDEDGKLQLRKAYGVNRFHVLDKQTPLALAAKAAIDNKSDQRWQTLLIDAQGYIVLRYAENADLSGMRKDIDRLIRQTNKALGLN